MVVRGERSRDAENTTRPIVQIECHHNRVTGYEVLWWLGTMMSFFVWDAALEV